MIIMVILTRILTSLMMLTILLAPETMERSSMNSPMSRVTLVQQQACSRAPDTGDTVTMVCRCPGEMGDTQAPAYLGVRMQGFLIRPQAKSEVSSSMQRYQSRKPAYLMYLQS